MMTRRGIYGRTKQDVQRPRAGHPPSLKQATNYAVRLIPRTDQIRIATSSRLKLTVTRPEQVQLS